MLKNIREMVRDKDGNTTTEKPAVNTEPTPPIDDPSEKLRAKAVATHSDADAVLQLAKSDDSAMVRDAATRRYTQLASDTEAYKSTLDSLYNATEHRALFFAIAAGSNVESFRTLSLAKAQTDEDHLIIADKAKFHDVRMTAAGKIESMLMIDKCWRSMKAKDKVVARELKTRLDSAREAKQAEESRANQIEKILTEMDKIANGVWQPSSANRFDHFSDQWAQLGFEPPTDKKSHYESLHKVADAKAQEWRGRQSSEEKRQSILDRLGELNDELNKTNNDELVSFLSACKASFKRQQTQWQVLQQETPADTAKNDEGITAAQRYQSLTAALSANIKTADIIANAHNQISSATPHQGNLQKAVKSLQGLKEQSSTAAYLSEVPQLLEKAKSKIDKKSAADTELKQQIHKQLGSLNSAIASKRWGPAKSILDRTAKKIAKLEAKERSSYTDKLARLEHQVKELGDWKEFASEPKLIELCEQMEKLPSLKMSANDCANRIKELQTQWKALGASPALEKQWPRFKQASDTAYEPCRKFFTERREEKKNKLNARKEICELLEKYEKETDWSAPDWRVVEKTLRTAKQAWKHNQVFDKKRGKPLDDRFTKILQLVDAKLDPVYDANALEKKELIERVNKLGESDINQHCINQVKSIQSAWRLTGACRQKEDRALWKEFSDAANKIFETHRSKKREEHAATTEHVRRARDIIRTLSSLSSAKEPLTEKDIADLQTEYAGLAEFPERDAKRLERDYRKATDAVDRFRHQAASNSRKRALQAMQQNADLCSQLEALAGQPFTEIEAQANTILDEWQPADKGENPKAAKAMEKRKDSILKLLKADKTPAYESNEAARRLLCIELEILCDAETPQEDKSMRMQYQLEQLQKGLQSNSTAGTRSEQIEQLQIHWMTSGPASAAVQDKLNSRFNETVESVKR